MLNRAASRLGGRLLACVLLAAAGLASRGETPHIGRPGTLSQEMRYMRWEGIALTPHALEMPVVAPEDNAAPLYRAIARELAASRLSAEESDLLESRLQVAQPVPADIEAGRAALARRRALMDLVHKAAASPDCRFQRDWTLGPSLQLPEYAVMRQAARLVRAEAAVMEAEGRITEAATTLGLLFNVADHASSDPILLAYLADCAIRRIALQGLQDLLQSHPDAATARAVRGVLSHGPRPNGIVRALEGEVVCALVSGDLLRKGSMRTLKQLAGEEGADQSPERPLPAGFVESNLAYVLWYQRSAINACKLPYPQARSRLDAFQSDLEARTSRNDLSVTLGMLLLPAYQELLVSATSREAWRRVIAAATQAVMYRCGRGKPAEALSGIPLDPFTGKPLVYRQEGQGFAVFTRGETGRYDGEPGQAGRRGNLFRL